MFDVSLLAAADDWMKIVFPVIVFVIWIASQVLSGGKKPQRRPGGPLPIEPDEADHAMTEIEQVLRQARGEVASEEIVRAEPLRTPLRQAPPPFREPSQPVSAEIVPLGGDFAGSVTAHVSQHLDTHEYVERAASLAEEVSLADEKLAGHLHEAFDHKVGDLAQTTTPSAASDATPTASAVTAHDIRDVFRTPRDVRRAIILSEILHRPEERWEALGR